MKRPISLPRLEGRTSRQAHANLPEGSFEREFGQEGFFGPATHLYHASPPTGWIDWEGPLRPRAFDLNRIRETQNSPWDAPCFLYNSHVRMRFWRAPERMTRLARNSDGDDLLFVHQGQGRLFCDFGHLPFEAGDYIVLPRSTMWRLECDQPVAALLIEAVNSAYHLPDKGIVGPHAVFDPAMLDHPRIDDAFQAQKSAAGEDGVWKIDIKRRDTVSTVTFPSNPLDTLGWKGDLCPVRINVRDLRPLMSHRYHLPPSAHTTFVSHRFVVCTFCPRPFETAPEALKVPFYHNNNDYDEVLFYHAGDFFSRDNIDAGMATFHPSGFTHGPHPGALKNAFQPAKPGTDEYAVMVDARDPLEVGALPEGVENLDYVNSWQSRTGTKP